MTPFAEIDPVVLVLGAGGTVVIAAALGLKGYVTAWFQARTRRLIERSVRDGLKRMAAFAQCLSDLDDLAFVDRVLLFTGRNGGGLPTPGRKYTVEVVQGWSHKDDQDPKSLYAGGLAVDWHYCDMLVEMMERGEKTNTVADMPKDAMLRAYYEDEGVFQTVLFLLGCDGATLTYMSVGNYTRAFEPSELVRIRRVVERLRPLMD